MPPMLAPPPAMKMSVPRSFSLRYTSPGYMNILWLLSSLLMVVIKVSTLFFCYSLTSPKQIKSTATPFFFSFLANILSVSISSAMVEAIKAIILCFCMSLARCLRASAPICKAYIEHQVPGWSAAPRVSWLRTSRSWPWWSHWSWCTGSPPACRPSAPGLPMIAGLIIVSTGSAVRRSPPGSTNGSAGSRRSGRGRSCRVGSAWLLATFLKYFQIIIIHSFTIIPAWKLCSGSFYLCSNNEYQDQSASNNLYWSLERISFKKTIDHYIFYGNCIKNSNVNDHNLICL